MEIDLKSFLSYMLQDSDLTAFRKEKERDDYPSVSSKNKSNKKKAPKGVLFDIGCNFKHSPQGYSSSSAFVGLQDDTECQTTGSSQNNYGRRSTESDNTNSCSLESAAKIIDDASDDQIEEAIMNSLLYEVYNVTVENARRTQNENDDMADENQENEKSTSASSQVKKRPNYIAKLRNKVESLGTDLHRTKQENLALTIEKTTLSGRLQAAEERIKQLEQENNRNERVTMTHRALSAEATVLALQKNYETAIRHRVLNDVNKTVAHLNMLLRKCNQEDRFKVQSYLNQFVAIRRSFENDLNFLQEQFDEQIELVKKGTPLASLKRISTPMLLPPPPKLTLKLVVAVDTPSSSKELSENFRSVTSEVLPNQSAKDKHGPNTFVSSSIAGHEAFFEDLRNLLPNLQTTNVQLNNFGQQLPPFPACRAPSSKANIVGCQQTQPAPFLAYPPGLSVRFADPSVPSGTKLDLATCESPQKVAMPSKGSSTNLISANVGSGLNIPVQGTSLTFAGPSLSSHVPLRQSAPSKVDNLIEPLVPTPVEQPPVKKSSKMDHVFDYCAEQFPAATKDDVKDAIVEFLNAQADKALKGKAIGQVKAGVEELLKRRFTTSSTSRATSSRSSSVSSNNPMTIHRPTTPVQISQRPPDSNVLAHSRLEFKQPDDCFICLKDLHLERQLKLDCGHVAHRLCLEVWISKNKTCPLCRQLALSENEYPHLF